MSKVLYFLFLFIEFSATFSSVPQFSAYRLNSNYKGICNNGEVLLCYGDFGILKRSIDRGNTWQHLALGDKLTIVKMVSKGKLFIACSKNSLLTSSNGGSTWIQKQLNLEFPVIDASLSNNSLYLLCKNGLFFAPLDNLPHGVERIVELESTFEYNDLELHNGYAFIVPDYSQALYKVNLSLRKIDTLYGIEKLRRQLPFFWVNQRLFSYNDTIFVTNKNVHGNDIFSFDVSYSIDDGNSWHRRTQVNLQTPTDALIWHSGNLHCLSPNYNGIEFIELYINGQNKIVGTSDIVNKRSSNPDRLSEKSIEEVIAISNDTLYAVGKSSFIARSVDGGKTWAYVSLCNANVVGTKADFNTTIGDKIQIHNLGSKNYNASFLLQDSQKLWIPHLSLAIDSAKILYSKRVLQLQEDGTTFIGYSSKKIGEEFPNVFSATSTEFEYKPFAYDSLLFVNSAYLRERIVPYNSELLNISNGRSLQLFHERILVDSSSQYKENVQFSVFNENLQRVYKGEIPLHIVSSYVRLNDTVFVLGYTKSGLSSGNFNAVSNYSYKYKLIKTTDGINWITVSDSLPLYQSLNNPRSDYYFWSDDMMNNLAIYKNKVYMPSYNHKLYSLDLTSKAVDSISTPFLFSNRQKNLSFVFNDKLFFVNSNQVLCYLNENEQWDSVQITSFLNARLDSTTFNGAVDDNILSIRMTSDSTGYFFLGRVNLNGIIANEFDVYVTYFSTNAYTNLVSVEEIDEDNDSYFYHSLPYPIPAHTSVSNSIYFWNVPNIQNDIKVEIYDIMGNKLQHQNITYQIEEIHKCKISWNCHTVPQGIYQVVYTIGKRTKSFQVLVSH